MSYNYSEIRGLYSGVYFVEEEDCSISIRKTDKGTCISTYDYDLEIYYHWVIDENGEVKSFTIGEISQS